MYEGTGVTLCVSYNFVLFLFRDKLSTILVNKIDGFVYSRWFRDRICNV